MTRPVLFVTNHAPPFRVPAFQALHERENVVFALIGGDVRHGGGGTRRATLPFPAIFPPERAVARLAASGRYRAVIAGLSGKVALPAAYAGARAGRVPFVLWATIWRHPRTPVARALLPPAAPHLPARGRDRHLRPARQRLRADQAPEGRGLRGASERRHRVLVGARHARAPRRLPDPVRRPPRSGEGLRRARKQAADARDDRRRHEPVARRKCATSTRAATLWSYRRFPRATSSSRGGSSSTKPSTREFP